jgi:hypothetical protein
LLGSIHHDAVAYAGSLASFERALDAFEKLLGLCRRQYVVECVADQRCRTIAELVGPISK